MIPPVTMPHSRSFASAAFAFFLATAADAGAQPIETPVEATGPTGTLRGTMAGPSPEPNGPVVLIVPGSGPTDRDGNNPLGIRASTYRMLAEELAERGIVSVRIDKRGMFGSADAAADPNDITIAGYAADVRAWTVAIRRRTGARCVWLAGHSEGGLVVSVAGRSDANACGLVLMAAPGRPMGEILRRQLAANLANAPILDEASNLISDLEAGRTVDMSGRHAALQGLFHPNVQPFLIDLFSYRPAAVLRAYRRPVLILQGTSDLQIWLDDGRTLAAALPGAELVELDGVNHVLKPAPADDREANVATYTDASLPLAAGVAETIAAFVHRHMQE